MVAGTGRRITTIRHEHRAKTPLTRAELNAIEHIVVQEAKEKLGELQSHSVIITAEDGEIVFSWTESEKVG